MNVRKLGIIYSKVPLVSNTIDAKYGKTQIPAGGGFYVFTNTSTETKKRQLDRINKALNLGWKVKIIL